MPDRAPSDAPSVARRHEVRFTPLELTPTAVHVRWSIDPPTPLYARESFVLDFGAELDPRTLPLDLWWTLVVMIMHSHWNLLRPCRVVLPVRLSGGEVEFWQRLMDHERDCLEWYRGGTDFDRTVVIECEGDAPLSGPMPAAAGGYATAYSSGRDSLLHSVLLDAIGEKPLLVNTCSAMPPLRDHTTPHLGRALSEITRRRGLDVVVVESDLRSSWPHYEAPHQLGFPISVPQVTDTYFHLAATIAVAAGRGIRTALLASEFENALISRYEGKLVSVSSTLTYSPWVLEALSRLFSRWGIECASLLTPVSGFQRQELLARYGGDVMDLQLSCFWMADDEQRYCSRCAKCFRIALNLMAVGVDPDVVGIDARRAFTNPEPAWMAFPPLAVANMKEAAGRLSTREAYRHLGDTGWLGRLRRRSTPALAGLDATRAAVAHADSTWVVLRRPAFERFIPQALRPRLSALYAGVWPETDPTDRSDDLATIECATAWLAEPLDRASASTTKDSPVAVAP